MINDSKYKDWLEENTETVTMPVNWIDGMIDGMIDGRIGRQTHARQMNGRTDR